MPIENIDLEKDYESGIVNALIKNSEKINELINIINYQQEEIIKLQDSYLFLMREWDKQRCQ